MFRHMRSVCFWIVLIVGSAEAQNNTDGLPTSTDPSTGVQNTTTAKTTTTEPTTIPTTTRPPDTSRPRIQFATNEEFIQYYNENNSTRKPEIWKDEAWLTINSTVKFSLLIYSQTEECWKCPLLKFGVATGENTTTFAVSTISNMEIKLARELASSHVEDICSFTVRFREGGDYWLFMDEDLYIKGACGVTINNDPTTAEMPLLFLVVGLALLAILWTLISMVLRRWRNESTECFGNSAVITGSTPSESIQTFNLDQMEKENGNLSHDLDTTSSGRGESSTEGVSSQDETPKKKKRLRSLDTFRGIALTMMVFVNYGGGGYWFFDHAPWNGLTVADLVFPWFIFIMGTSMNYAFRGMIRRNTPRVRIGIKIFKRTILLFGIGVILNTGWGPVDLTEIRIFNVLQRIALSYCVVAVVEFLFLRTEDSYQEARWAVARDIVLHLPAWGIHVTILAVFLGITYALPVPGCPTGYTGPGGIGIDKMYENCTGGAARYVDVTILGEKHMYQYPTTMNIYKTKIPYDPEGILGTLPTIFLCFLGVQSGRIIMTFDSHIGRCSRWLIWAAVTGVIAAVLCQGSANEGFDPLNKNLWSVSYSLTTASFSFILLTVLYVIIDVFNVWSGAPFIYPGMNSIVVYVSHMILWRLFPISWYTESVHWKLLLQDTWGTAIFVFLGFVMHQKNIFITL